MIRTIRTEPDPILRQRSPEVTAGLIQSAEIQSAISDLKETLAASRDGIGIAAPQIGIAKRIFIVSEESKYIDLPQDERPKKEKNDWAKFVYINPVLSRFSRKKIDGAEGCLSVPGTFGIVARHEKISVMAYDEGGRQFSLGASKFFARVLQHELDHLDGILFIDRAKRLIEPPADDSQI
ncbi:MAG: peptide deformylase [Candidatus Sungbacteria bacterium RIFCSPHIGHO2_02_FULL_49_12]|uniref:Peptide deformylase n=1 Tax=Candidatus Sungbacteria bacterium RIFCSPHIGHO2_02_FULL_49_12 TaxID=1802271 RepID=A0A1G2KTD6_9BACT|nr:MAG: peptide deformylase [Candidatus Sungbacteria bacterium RIFCSPHIGHO2_02_FULL_49_12]